MTQPSVLTAQPVPERPALPLVGHALSLPKGFAATVHMMKEVKELGPVYRVRAFGTELVIVGGLDLVTELADESRFRKNVHPELVDIRQFAGDGLFTAFNHEANCGRHMTSSCRRSHWARCATTTRRCCGSPAP